MAWDWTTETAIMRVEVQGEAEDCTVCSKLGSVLLLETTDDVRSVYRLSLSGVQRCPFPLTLRLGSQKDVTESRC